MRRLALDRCFRAAPLETFVAAVFVCLLIVLLRNDAHAQFLPSGCPGQWVQGGGGMMCRCPDGSYANMVGDQIVCNNRGNSGSNGNVCPNGGTCRSDQTCCGNLCCNQGSYCSRYGCTPYGAVDCGTGYCNPGQQCNRNGQCIPAGTVDCGHYYCNAGHFCGRNNHCIPEGNIECGDHSCRPGFTCGSNDACMPNDAVDCGDGRYCAAGSRCQVGRCISQAAVQQPNVGNRVPPETNLRRGIEPLRQVDWAMFVGALALVVGLLLIEAMYRSRKKKRGQPEGELPALPKGSAPLEGGATSSVAPVPPDVTSASEPSSEHRDVGGVSEPSSTDDDSPWAVHSKAGVKRSPWAAAPMRPVVSAPPAASHEPREVPVEQPLQRASESSVHPVYREARLPEAVAPKPDQGSPPPVPNAGLLIASMVLGIIGGALGLLIALFGYTNIGAAGAISGQGSQAALIQLVIIASPIASIVGAAIVRSSPPAGAVLMGVSVVSLLLFFGFNSFTIVPVLLNGLGAALAVLAIVQANSKSS